MESLIKSGAMDGLGRRAQLMAVVDNAMEHAAENATRFSHGPARLVRGLRR